MPRTSRRSNQERREQSTEQVLESALKLFVCDGYGSTSIDDIARAAKLTKGAVYFYFKGKSALLLELLGQSSRLYDAVFTRMRDSGLTATEQLNIFVDWWAEVGVENKELLLLPILMSLEFFGRDEEVERCVQSMYQRYHDEIERVTALGQSTGEFDSSLSPHERAAVLVAFTDGMLLEWYRFSDRLDGGILARSARAQIFDGLRPAPVD